MDRPNLKVRTLQLYESRFRSIAKLTGTEDIQFLELPPLTVVKMILDSNYSLSTKKAFLGCLTALSQCLSDSASHSLFQQAFEQIRGVLDSVTKKNLCTKKQSENWISLDKLREFVTDKIDSCPKNELTELILLALFSFRPPRRATDYAKMKWVFSEAEKIDNSFNYLVYNPTDGNMSLIFNEYKTKDIYGTQTFEITNKNLKRLIQRAIQQKILIQNAPLIPKSDYSFHFFYEIGPLLTKCVQRNPVWKYKGVNPTFFRTLWATEQLASNISYHELEELAKTMGTSAKMLQIFYRKVDPPSERQNK